MKTKAVIFDFNGTLFFDNDKHIKAWEEVSILIRGHGISEDELHTKFNGVPNNQIISYMFKGNCSQDELNQYSELKEKFYRQFCAEDQANFHLVAGAENYFNELKSKEIPFTIASASIKENIDFFVESFQLDQWIEPNTIVYDNGTYENKVMMFKDAAKLLNVPLEECLIIEDSKSGITNAYVAGCENIIVVNSANKRSEYEKLPGVISVIDTFEEI